MKHDHEQARLRATYADLLDDDDTEDLLPFIGALDAAHSTPPLPDSVRTTLAQPRWAKQERLQLAKMPGRKGRPMPLRTLTAWVRDRLTSSPRPQSRRWANLNQTINAATTIVLVLGIALGAFLLLGQPARLSRGNAAPANGNWVYPGVLDGRSGIISVTPDGTARLLIEGGFYGVTPSPDGRRLIAYGNRNATIWPEPEAAAALYTADGQLLRRYTLGGTTPLIPYWSPDSRKIAFFARVGLQAGMEGDYRTWLLDESGEREIQLGQQTFVGTPSGVGAWSSRGDLILSAIATDSNGDGRITHADRQQTWILRTDDNAPRSLQLDALVHLGWSRDGSSAYLLSTTAIIAVAPDSGASKPLAQLAEVTDALHSQAALQGAPLAETITGFDYGPAAVAPSGDRIAIWLLPETGESANIHLAPYLVVLDTQGQIVGVTRGTANTRPLFIAWSPDGTRLAYSAERSDNTLSEIRVVNSTDTTLDGTPATLASIASQSADAASLRWSPDSRQLAFSINGLIEIASGTNLTERRRLPGSMYGWPNWQPAP